ncbi:MAG: ribose-5-phosphate isomerase RpiA [Rhodobacteraceae bacterium]|nr:ribose-5-phosphate isomerase RpiA [Paracoccaceae bacterium]
MTTEFDELSLDTGKRAAAGYALGLVRDGARIGLGTGSTADIFIDLLAEDLRRRKIQIAAVATSRRTEERARQAGLELSDLNRLQRLDLTVDGADEIDPELDLIKGGGGALLREKIVADASDRLVIMADAGKMVRWLGGFPLPVEVTQFGWEATGRRLDRMLRLRDGERRLRLVNGKPFVSDGGNYIFDISLRRIRYARAMERRLETLPGVVVSGLFVGRCDFAVIGTADGMVQVLSRRS